MTTRTILVGLLAVGLLALVPGCEQKSDIGNPNVSIGTPTTDPGPVNDLGQADLTKMGSDYGTTGNPVNGGTTVADPPVGTSGGVGQPPSGQRIHVMAPRDNIFRLGEKYYGRATKANEQKILQANPKYAANPNKIPVGAEIIIPE